MANEDKKINDPDIEANKGVAALSYVWLLFLIPMLTKRKSKFCQFHAKQGLVLFIIEVIASIIFWLPFIGQLLMLGLIIIVIISIVKTLNGEWWKIPYVYDWSKKINL